MSYQPPEPPAERPGGPPPGQPPGPPPDYNWQPSYYPPQPGSAGTNGMAIASMVLGIVWIYWIGSILALVFGFIALSQIRDRGQGGRGMAIAGIVLGFVGIGVLVLSILVLIANPDFLDELERLGESLGGLALY